jgi:uncharacterized protein (DUF2236 family)
MRVIPARTPPTADNGLVPTDPGLFGPDSVTWRVHADPSMALAGLRALMLQTLHPLAMAGVAQHSDYRSDPWRRLQRTAEYVGVTTFGTTDEAQAAAARVRTLHASLSGVEPESGLPYRVDDPDLLVWVHCCETESFLSTALRCGLRVSAEDQDRYYEEQTGAAALLGLEADEVPASRAQVERFFTNVRPFLRPTAHAREAMRFLLWPPMPAKVELTTPARAGWTTLATTAAALLPRWARRAYGLPGLPTTDLGASAFGFALRTAALLIPEGVRTGPHVKAAQERLATR